MRRIRKICQFTLIVTVIVTIVLMITIHGLLHSDLPKKWLQRRLMSLGDVQASIADMDIHWDGQTTITGLRLTEPDQALPLLDIHTIELNHTPLIPLLLTRRFDLNTLHMAKPQLHIQQTPSGAWNVQAIATHFPAKDRRNNTRRPLRSLPEIEVTDALITVTDATDTTMTFAESHFNGHSTGTGIWTFNGNLGTGLAIDGTVELTETLKHTLTLNYTGNHERRPSLFGIDLSHVRVNGQWTGQVSSSGLSGTLRLDKAETDAFSGSAHMTLRADLQSMDAALQEGTWQFKADPNQTVHADAGRLHWQRQDNRLSLTQTSLAGFGGRLMLDLHLPLARSLQIVTEATLQDLELSQLAKVLPDLQGLTGSVSGTLTTQIADAQSQAPEPLAVALDLEFKNGRYKQADLDRLQATAYVGPTRWIVDQSQVDCLKGHARFWTRTSRHQDERLIYINTDFNDIDLKQALGTLGVHTQKAVGKATGQGMIIVQSGTGTTGEIGVTLQQADLLNTSVVGALYNTLNLKLLGTDRPTGEGLGTFQLEGKQLRLSRFRYFNRGVELRGSVTMQNVTLGAQSPIDGYVMATTRPLKGQKLPGLADLDRLLNSLQKNVVTAQIQNTMGDPKVKVVPFAQVQTALKGLLWKQLGSAQ